MIDRNRRHTFIDLKCFRRLAEASGIEGLLTNIRVPKFTIARTSDPSSGHNSSLRFNNEPPTEYWEHLFAEIAKRERMKAHFTGERLVVRINNHEVGYFVGKRRAQIGFEITEDDNIVSIAGFQEEEEIPLATLFPGSYGLFDLKPGHQWNGETRCGDARIGIRIKQLAATIDGDRSLSVEVNYQRARQLPAWTTIFIEPRIRARALQTAAAALLFAVSYGAYQFLTDRRPWEIPPVSVAKLAVEKNQTRTATKDHGENSASRTNRDKPTIAIGKGERKFSLNNRNFVHLLTLAPGVSDNLSPLQVQKSGIDAPKGEEILESTGSKMIRDVKKSETKQEGPKTGRIEPMQKDASELD